MAKTRQPAKKADRSSPDPAPVATGTLPGIVDANGRAIAHEVGEGIKGDG